MGTVAVSALLDGNDAIKRHVSENHKRKLLFGQPRDSRGWSMTYFIDEVKYLD